MRVALCGQRSFGVAVGNLLLERGDNISMVFSPADDKLAWFAQRNYLSWRSKPVASNMPDNLDLIIAAHSHDFISQKARLRARFGGLGYHPSLLPLHRGRDSVAWVIKMRERVTGGSVYWLSNTVDGGPIAAQSHVFVYPDDDASTLWRRSLFPLGIELFDYTLNELDCGRCPSTPQDRRLATWEPALDPPPLYRPDLILLRDMRNAGK